MTSNRDSVTGRAEGEPLNRCPTAMVHGHPCQCDCCVGWCKHERRPPSDPSTGEGRGDELTELREEVDCLSRGFADATEGLLEYERELAALRDRVHGLERALRKQRERWGGAEYWTAKQGFAAVRDAATADIDRALAPQEPPAKEPTP